MNIISGYGLFGHQLVGVKIYISLDMKELLKVLATPRQPREQTVSWYLGLPSLSSDLMVIPTAGRGEALLEIQLLATGRC